MRNNKFKKKYAACCAAITCLLTAAARGADLSESPLGVGLKRLLSDVSTYILVLSPIIAGVAAVVFLIRRSMADQADGKLWSHRIIVAVICGVGGMLVGGVIELITGYFV